MEYVCNLNSSRLDPFAWVKSRASEGWSGYLVTDHIWDPTGPSAHVWSVLGALVASTRGSKTMIGSGFANNLLRHPVEFAQASLTLQRISDGRFEAGLGAGWSADEMEGTGREMPEPSVRASRLIEAVQICRELFDHGSCTFDGEHFQVDVKRLERLGEQAPPPLVVGAGGPRIIRAVTPIVDKLEILPTATAARSGSIDGAAFAAVSLDSLRSTIDLIRDLREDLPIRIHVGCCAGEDERTRKIAQSLPEGSFSAGFYGSPTKVADSILGLADLGIAEVHLSPNDTYTYENLAPILLAAH